MFIGYMGNIFVRITSIMAICSRWNSQLTLLFFEGERQTTRKNRQRLGLHDWRKGDEDEEVGKKSLGFIF